MDHILIQHGKTPAEVRQKLIAQLQDMYEVSPGVFDLVITPHHTAKAMHSISRMKKKQKEPALEVSFNSAYFTDV